MIGPRIDTSAMNARKIIPASAARCRRKRRSARPPALSPAWVRATRVGTATVLVIVLLEPDPRVGEGIPEVGEHIAEQDQAADEDRERLDQRVVLALNG